MATVTATPDPAHGYIVLDVNYTSDPTATEVYVTRQPPVPGVDVRTGTFPLSAGRAVIHDTEAPMGVAITYVVLGNGAAVTVTTAPVTLQLPDAAGSGWLKDPLRPCNDLMLIGCWEEDDPDCDPDITGVVWVNHGVQEYPGATTGVDIENASLPVGLVHVRKGMRTVLQFMVPTFLIRDAFLALVQPGNVLLFQFDSSYGVADLYVIVGDVTVERLAEDHRDQLRLFTLPVVVTDAPAGTAEGVCGTRWMDLCGITWAAAEAAGKTWADVVNGLVP